MCSHVSICLYSTSSRLDRLVTSCYITSHVIFFVCVSSLRRMLFLFGSLVFASESLGYYRHTYVTSDILWCIMNKYISYR